MWPATEISKISLRIKSDFTIIQDLPNRSSLYSSPFSVKYFISIRFWTFPFSDMRYSSLPVHSSFSSSLRKIFLSHFFIAKIHIIIKSIFNRQDQPKILRRETWIQPLQPSDAQMNARMCFFHLYHPM